MSVHNMDEASGNRADTVNAYHLTQVGTVGRSTTYYKKIGSADFDKSVLNYLWRSAYVPQSMTVSFWFRCESLTSVPLSGGSYGALLEITDSLGNFLWTPLIQIADSVLYLSISDGSYNFKNIAGGLISFNTWYHITTVSNGTSHSLYVNGSHVGTDTLAINRLSATMNRVGIMNDGFGGLIPFDGQIDEFCVWNTSLSASAIAALYNSGTGKFYNP